MMVVRVYGVHNRFDFRTDYQRISHGMQSLTLTDSPVLPLDRAGTWRSRTVRDWGWTVGAPPMNLDVSPVVALSAGHYDA